MPSTPSFCFFPRGSYCEFDSATISPRFIVVKLRISRRTSLRFTSITSWILGRTSNIAKEDLGFWSPRDLVAPIGLTFDFGDLGQVLVSGDFGPLLRELYDLGNILESNTRHNGMVRVGFLE
jgi:hypothetical protein